MARCLQSIRRAALHPGLRGEAVQVVVALDDCSDATASICRQQRVDTVQLQARCVGVAGQRLRPSCCNRERAGWPVPMPTARCLRNGWSPSWRAAATPSADWWTSRALPGTASACVARSGKGSLGATITGASTAPTSVSLPAPIVPRGLCAPALREDVALVSRLQCLGADVRWAGAPVVMTSARLVGRATGGSRPTCPGSRGACRRATRNPARA